MNRSLIVVQMKPKMFCSIRVHWNYGQEIEDWLNNLNLSEIHSLIGEGHRSTIAESYRSLLCNDCNCNHWTHKTLREAIYSCKTLREAIYNCEHMTLAYHNGKKWKFTHNN